MFLGYQDNKIKYYSNLPIDKDRYNLDLVEQSDEEYILVDDEYVLKTDIKALNQAKEAKIAQNDTLRDEKLNQGVEYKGVLFDSDTDQKVNLLAIISTMDSVDSVIWFGKDNQPLECTKEDLTNIGSLITDLHTNCWIKNAQIKANIENSTTIAQLKEIEIDY